MRENQELGGMTVQVSHKVFKSLSGGHKCPTLARKDTDTSNKELSLHVKEIPLPSGFLHLHELPLETKNHHTFGNNINVWYILRLFLYDILISSKLFIITIIKNQLECSLRQHIYILKLEPYRED